jgi:hypothetical protein
MFALSAGPPSPAIPRVPFPATVLMVPDALILRITAFAVSEK